MRILLTGFEAFGGEEVNPTELLMREVQRRSNELLPEGEIRALVLPVSFKSSFARLEEEIEAFRPEVAISFGLAAGRSSMIEIERVAINLIDCEIADNEGQLLREQPILETPAPPAYFSSLPVRQLVDALNGEAISARISNTAGTYVCNYLFYRLRHLAELKGFAAGFVHVPFLDEQVRGRSPEPPSLSFEQLFTSLKVIVKKLAQRRSRRGDDGAADPLTDERTVL